MAITQDFFRSNLSKYITKCVNKYNGIIKYEVYFLRRYKSFDQLKQAQKYIDLICLQNNKPQIYDTFKSK